jgi:hypothetical protein
MLSLQNLRYELERCKGERDRIIKLQDTIIQEVSQLEGNKQVLEEARIIVQIVAKETQKSIQFHISDLVTHALSAIFPDPYTFKLEFVVRRDKTEADLVWEREGFQYYPNGGGVRDVSSFGMRIALWSLKAQRSQPILIFDEPFKHTCKGMLNKIGLMISEISKALKLQIIIISHADELIKLSDTSYRVVRDDKRVSHAAQII